MEFKKKNVPCARYVTGYYDYYRPSEAENFFSILHIPTTFYSRIEVEFFFPEIIGKSGEQHIFNVPYFYFIPPEAKIFFR